MKLGDMTKEDAQKELVQLLYKAAPVFKEYASEQWQVLKQEEAIKKIAYVILSPFVPCQ